MQTRRRVAATSLAAAALSIATIGSPASAGDAFLRVLPSSVEVAKGQLFAVKVEQNAASATSGAQASLAFDPSVVQIVSVTPGASYADAPIFVPQDLGAAVRAANLTGKLAQIAAAFTPPGATPAGANDFLVVRFRAVGCGQTDLQLPIGPSDAALISGAADDYGASIPLTTSGGHVTTCVSADQVTQDAAALAATPGDAGPPLGLLGAVAAAAIAVLGGLNWQGRRRRGVDDELVD